MNTGVLKSDGTLADDTSGFRSCTPIGNSSKKYTGKFDGQGHTISGLYCNISTSSAGLFGCLDYGEIKNVGVIDSYFNGSNYVGGVCAWNYGGKITACYNTGTLKSDSSVGGVCGWNLGGKITGCYSIGTVNGSGSVGGVCRIKDGTITGCYTNRDGDTYYKPNDEFTNGTVCGLLNTALQNVNPDAYFYQGANYPVLIVISNLPKLVDGVYQISNEKELYAFAQLVNSGAEPSANAVITADIIVNTGVLKSDGTLADDTSSFTSWTPIGNSSNKYTGSFNGQNHTVSGLYFNNTSTSYVGLFGCLGSGGEIRNTGVIDSYFRGYSFVGGICGENNSGTITDCYNTGTVSSSYNYAGGVCAVNRNTITGCYNTGRVSGRSRVGGVSGWNGNSGTIIGCYNTGTVSSSNNYVGGVCGYNYTTITGCYNTGKVSGSSPIGAVCGYSTSTGTITNCYFDRDRYSGNAVGTNEGTATDVEGKATAQFASGEVAYLLNGSTSEGTLAWGQTICPVIGGGSGKLHAVLGQLDDKAPVGQKILSDYILGGQAFLHCYFQVTAVVVVRKNISVPGSLTDEIRQRDFNRSWVNCCGGNIPVFPAASCSNVKLHGIAIQNFQFIPRHRNIVQHGQGGRTLVSIHRMCKMLDAGFDGDGICQSKASSRLNAVNGNTGRRKVGGAHNISCENIGNTACKGRTVKPLVVLCSVDRFIRNHMRVGTAFSLRQGAAVEQYHQVVFCSNFSTHLHLLHGSLCIAFVVVHLDALDSQSRNALEFTYNGFFVQQGIIGICRIPLAVLIILVTGIVYAVPKVNANAAFRTVFA